MIYIYPVLLALLITTSGSEKTQYKNYGLYKIIPENQLEVEILKQYAETNNNVDFWTDVIRGSFVNVFVGPDEKYNFEAFLNHNGIDFTISFDDAQSLIEKQTVKKYVRSSRILTWDAYYGLDDIYQWLDDLAAAYPDIVTTLIGGVSLNGRNIRGVKIAHESSTEKRAIFLEHGIHCREWISPALATYVINELLTGDPSGLRQFAQEFDWYIFPVTNPDGYVYTFEEARLWRKNLRHNHDGTYGVDLNRNWDSHWMVTGASNITSSETYAGTTPFSEPETKSLSNFIHTVGHKLDLYLSVHSYSQLLMIPYGHTTEPLNNYNEAMAVANRTIAALAQRYGTVYRAGNTAETIYEAAGTSPDWIKDTYNTSLVYCYELRDNGLFGFLLPVEQIIPNNLEVVDSMIAMITAGKEMGLMTPWTGDVTGDPVSGAETSISSLVVVMTMALLLVKFA